MAVILRDHGVKPRHLSPSPVVDGAGNIFLGYILNTGFDNTTLLKIVKIDPAGQLHPIAEWQSEEGKEDNAAIVQSGADLHAFITAHQGDPDCNTQHHVFQNVCVPYPGGAPQVGAPGAFVPGGTPDPTPEPVDYERIAAMVDGAAAQLEADLVRAFGGNVRQGIEDKAKDAVRELGLWSQSLQDRGLDQWLRDRVYEVLRDNGLIRGTEVQE